MTTSTFYIQEPIWSGRKVGLAADKIADVNIVIIEYRDKAEKLLYPRPFTIFGKKAREYPVQPAKKDPSTKLFIIPIADLTLPEEGDYVGRLVLYTGEEIEITSAQYDRVMASLDDQSSQYVEIGRRGVKKSNISLVEDDEPVNPANVDRSPEAIAKRQQKHRDMLDRKTKRLS